MKETFEEYVEQAGKGGRINFAMETWKDGDGRQCRLTPVGADEYTGYAPEFLVIGNNLIPVDDGTRRNPSAEAFTECPECKSKNLTIQNYEIDSRVACGDCHWYCRVRYPEEEGL
ncbi:hypothetical protein [Nitrospina gracilis]|uniref:hypothetical protein n=1 Tax=Nitrospina gracilis TaxID=35801 RepID=UPI001F4514E5|nr:hypothetical protein [Nitrospina gracilis]MCF8719237.1 hypothetical protein [Nitrospina gracilis Nb-211]